MKKNATWTYHTIVWRVHALAPTSFSQTSVPTAWWMADFPNWIKFQLKIYIFLRRIRAFVYPRSQLLLLFFLVNSDMHKAVCYNYKRNFEEEKNCLCWCGNFHFAMLNFCQRIWMLRDKQKKLTQPPHDAVWCGVPSYVRNDGSYGCKS